jgi:hypothetical protein
VILLGLILVIIALAAAVLLFLATDTLTTPIDLEAVGFKVGMTPLALLIAGAAVMLLLWLGLALIRGSVRRRSRPRREAKEAQRQAEFEENIRADERSRAEEMHQQSLADRDRVREQEFESRLAERDRARDEELRSRAREDEAQIRADERARVERELAQRHSAGQGHEAGAAAVGAGLGAAAAGGRSHEGDQPYDRQQGEGAEGDLGPRTDESGASGSSTREGDEVSSGPSQHGDAATERTHRLGQEDSGDDGGHERTVADKIMHRD